MVMAVEKSCNTVLNHQLVNGVGPSRPTNVKCPGSPVVVIPSPLNVGHRIGAASSVVVRTSGHLMSKDKLECGLTVCESLLKPLVLFRTQGPIPPVAGSHLTGFSSSYISDVRFEGRIPERINHHK